MSIMDSIKEFFGLTGFVDADDDYDMTDDEPERSSSEHRRASSGSSSRSTSESTYRERVDFSGGRTRGVEYSITDEAGSESSSGRPFFLVVNEPKEFDACSKIVDDLKENKPVIINLERLETSMAKRIFDFLTGGTYALEGSVQKVANNIFIFAPNNVDVTSNIEEMKSFENANLFK